MGSPQRARALTWRRIHGGPGTFSRAGASGNPSGWRRHSGARRIPDRNGGAQALYLLPRDHTFHGGAFYETGLLEWVFFSEDGTADYGFGPGMTYLPGRPWISPTTRVPYYTRGRLVTPQANYFLTPIVENQETLIPWPRYGLWEGTVWVRQDAEDGPVVGRGYLECPNRFGPFSCRPLTFLKEGEGVS